MFFNEEKFLIGMEMNLEIEWSILLLRVNLVNNYYSL